MKGQAVSNHKKREGLEGRGRNSPNSVFTYE
jgi:hypothetical protein